MRTVSLLAGSLLLWLALPALGQTTRRPQQVFSIDTSVSSLRDVHLSDPGALVDHLARTPGKSEFETWASYVARVNTLSRPFYAIPIDCFLSPPAFDADSGAMRLSFRADDPPGEFVGSAAVINCSTVPSGGYIGVTAFGVRQRVSSSREREVLVGSAKIDNSVVPHWDFGWPIDAASAEREKPTMRAVLVLRPSAGDRVALVWGKEHRHFPTWDNPHDWTRVSFGITADEAQVWVVNRATGAILRKIPIIHDGRVVEQGR